MTDQYHCIMGAPIVKPGDVEVIDLTPENHNGKFGSSTEVYGFCDMTPKDAVKKFEKLFGYKPKLLYRVTTRFPKANLRGEPFTALYAPVESEAK
jgi:hypothetical protein